MTATLAEGVAAGSDDGDGEGEGLASISDVGDGEGMGEGDGLGDVLAGSTMPLISNLNCPWPSPMILISSAYFMPFMILPSTLAILPTFKKETIEALSHWIRLRNIISHEYLDVKWDSIKKFILVGQLLYSDFLYALKSYLSGKEKEITPNSPPNSR